MLRAGRTTRSAPPPPRRVCCAAATARRRRGGARRRRGRWAAQMVGRPHRLVRRPRQPETVRRRVDGARLACAGIVYAASCIFVVASVRPALRFALLSTGRPGSATSGRPRRALWEAGGMGNQPRTALRPHGIFALVSFMAASLLLRCSCCSLSRLQDGPFVFFGYRCDGAVPAVATPNERGSTSSLPASGAARSPRVPQGPPRRARSRTQDGQARHHLGSVRLDLHAEPELRAPEPAAAAVLRGPQSDGRRKRGGDGRDTCWRGQREAVRCRHAQSPGLAGRIRPGPPF